MNIWTLSGTGAFPIDDITDVDTSTDAPAKNEVLKWNGSTWVPAVYNATFTFSCTAFDDGLTSGILAGSGEWKAAEAISYTASYNNPPPTSADVKMSINGATYLDVGHMDGATYTTGKNYDGAINYPTVDQYLRFRLHSSDGEDSDIDYAASLYFRNYIFYGPTETGSGFDEAAVEALSKTISSSYTASRSINATGANYVVWAYPSRYTSIHATGARFNSVTMPFTSPETVGITNTAGLTENYKVFASTATGLGSSTLVLSTASIIINKIYWGGSTTSTGWNEAAIEALDESMVSNDPTQTWTLIALDASEYFIFAMPSRLSTPTFYDNDTGFEASFEDPATLELTNVNGHAENYKIFRSENILGPGNFTLRTA